MAAPLPKLEAYQRSKSKGAIKAHKPTFGERLEDAITKGISAHQKGNTIYGNVRPRNLKQPTGWRADLANRAGKWAGGIGLNERAVREMTTMGLAVGEVLPFIGEAALGADTVETVKNRDWLGTGINAGAMALSAIPIVGPGVGKAFKSALSPGAKAAARDLAKMTGRPPLATSARKVEQLAEGFLGKVERGAGNADWYKKSGRAAMEHFGENQPRTVKFVGGEGVTSSATDVAANLEHTVRGHNQWLNKSRIRTGRFPTAMGRDMEEIYNGPDMGIEELLNRGDEVYGPKRSPYIQQNLMREGGRDVSTARPVHDRHDAHALGFPLGPDETLSGPQHRWGDKQYADVLIPEANQRGIGGRNDWDANRIQAAGWIGERYEKNIAAGMSHEAALRQAELDYSDVWERLYASHSWESAPGSTTGHLEGFADLPWDQKAEYHEAMKGAFLTDDGRSKIALGYGAPTGRSYDAPGYFEGHFNPGTQDQVAIARATGLQQVDPDSARRMDAHAATQVLLGGQNAGAWNFLSPTRAPMRNKKGQDVATGYKFDLGHPINMEEYERYGPGVREAFGDQVGLLPDPEGMRLSKFYGDAKVADYVDNLRKQHPELPRPTPTTHSGGYVDNRWNTPQGRFGGDVVQGYNEPDGRGVYEGLRNLPDIGKQFDSFAPDVAQQIADIDPGTLKGSGLVGAKDMDRLIKTIGNEGWGGVVKLVESQKGSVEAKTALLASIAGLAGISFLPEE